MKKIIIHIGLEKTGTTTLQIFLRQNKEALERNGFSYLGDDSKPYVHGIAHFPIVASFFKKCPNFIPQHKHRSSTEVLDALASDIDNSENNIILSCEHFSSRLVHIEDISAFKNALPDRKIQIICYLRRQDEQAISLYSTLVKSGTVDAFSTEDIIPENRYFDYKRILKDWSTVFGRDKIIIRNYDRSSLVNNDICSDFIWLLGLDDHNLSFLDDQNVSLDSLQAEMLRKVNKYLVSFPWGTWDVDIQEFEKSQNVRAALIPLLPRGVKIRSLMSHSERQEILKKFQADNMEIADMYEGAEFIRRWHDDRGPLPSSSAPSKVTFADFEKALVACGMELTTNVSRIEELDRQNRELRHQRDSYAELVDDLRTYIEDRRFGLTRTPKRILRKIWKRFSQ